jgi:hypothetical protein
MNSMSWQKHEVPVRSSDLVVPASHPQQLLIGPNGDWFVLYTSKNGCTRTLGMKCRSSYAVCSIQTSARRGASCLSAAVP